MNPAKIAKSALSKLLDISDDELAQKFGSKALDEQFDNAVAGTDIWNKLPKSSDDVARIGNNIDTSQQLLGIHAIGQDTLGQAVDLGGFARPSQAVFNPSKWTGGKLPNADFGDVYLVANKSLMDRSRKYNGDAWTSMFPVNNVKEQYKPNNQFIDEIWDKYGDAYMNSNPLFAKSKEQLADLVTDDNKFKAKESLMDMYLAGNGLDRSNQIDYVKADRWANDSLKNARVVSGHTLVTDDGQVLEYTPDNVSQIMMNSENTYGRAKNDDTVGTYEMPTSNDVYENTYQLANNNQLRDYISDARDNVAKQADRQLMDYGVSLADGSGSYAKYMALDDIPEGFDDDLYEKLDAIHESYVNAPRPYFELKPDNGATGADFWGAYIPYNASQDVVDNLNKLGITNINRYGGDNLPIIDQLRQLQTQNKRFSHPAILGLGGAVIGSGASSGLLGGGDESSSPNYA